MKKQMLMIVLVIGILIGTGGCTFTLPELLIIDRTNIQADIERNKKSISLQVKWPALKFDNNLNTLLQQERSIGAISRYNYNNLTSPYIIGKPPTNRVDWMKWHVMNVKSGKQLEK